MPSIHHCALDDSDSLPPGQHICTCKCLAQTLHISISAHLMILCASPLKIEFGITQRPGLGTHCTQSMHHMHG